MTTPLLPPIAGGAARLSRPYRLINDDILNFTHDYCGSKFHAILSDPPYNLDSISKRFGKRNAAPAKPGVYGRSSRGFMGKEWDTDVAFNPDLWERLADHLLPGGFIMAFSSTRTYHRMACAMEDAGLIIHPMIVWAFGSGFPKATRLDKQIDRMAGVEQPVIGTQHRVRRTVGATSMIEDDSYVWQDDFPITAPGTDLAQEWSGYRYGLQALKPALEPICIAQRPYDGRTIDCITSTGAGAWNIDVGRIGTSTDSPQHRPPASNRMVYNKFNYENDRTYTEGRWPANLVLTHDSRCGDRCVEGCPVLELDRQSGFAPAGHSVNGSEYSSKSQGVYGNFATNTAFNSHNDYGGASRYFHRSDWAYEIGERLTNTAPFYYEGKATSSERELGLESFPIVSASELTGRQDDSAGLHGNPALGYDHNPLAKMTTERRNIHPTVKPIDLTQYLATLLLPPDSYAPRRLLVPFAGSGSEMIGAMLAGWDEIVGVELSADYSRIAQARLKYYANQPVQHSLFEIAV